MLKIQQFIKDHVAWETLLSEKPYCIQVSRDTMLGHKLIMFKYSQIDSDFNDPVVRECRGLILDEDTLEPVVVPFFKFGNYGESYCPNIDWASARVLQKVDGSLIKIVRIDDKLLISTNGTIDAFKAPVAEQIGCRFKSFGEIVVSVLASKGISTDDFSCGSTYMFELVSPWTRVVVPWKDNDLFLLGIRDNKTFKETLPFDSQLSSKFKTPKIYPLKTLDECVNATKELPWDDEGYVVVDKNFNRVKIKSIAYVAAHHLKNNGVMSYARAVELARANEIAEVVAYFPEFMDALNDVKTKYEALEKEFSRIDESVNKWIVDNGYDKKPWLIENGGVERKKLAMWAFKETKHPNVVFGIIDKKYESSAEWLKTVKADMIVKWLGYKE